MRKARCCVVRAAHVFLAANGRSVLTRCARQAMFSFFGSVAGVLFALLLVCGFSPTGVHGVTINATQHAALMAIYAANPGCTKCVQFAVDEDCPSNLKCAVDKGVTNL